VDARGNPCGEKVALSVLKAFTEPFRHRDEADVLALIERRIKGEMSDAAVLLPSEQGIPLAEVEDRFVSSPKRADVGDERLAYCRRTIADFVKFAGNCGTLAEVTEDIASKWAEKDWARGISPTTFNSRLAVMRVVWSTLSPKANGVLVPSPFACIKKKKDGEKIRRALTDDEIAALLETAWERYGGDVRTIILTGIYTGMRLGDCATLKWDEVDFSSGVITKVTAKTGEKVVVPILPEYREALLAHKARLEREYARARKMGWSAYWEERTPCDPKFKKYEVVDEAYTAYVVPRLAKRIATSKPLVSHLMSATFERAGIATNTDKARGVKNRSVTGFHSLRHTFCTKLAKAGVDVHAAMALVGHRSKAVHEVYEHMDTEYPKTEMGKVAGVSKKKGK